MGAKVQDKLLGPLRSPLCNCSCTRSVKVNKHSGALQDACTTARDILGRCAGAKCLDAGSLAGRVLLCCASGHPANRAVSL